MANVRVTCLDHGSDSRIVLYQGDDHHQAAALVQGIMVSGGRNSLGLEVEWGGTMAPSRQQSEPPRREQPPREQPPPPESEEEAPQQQETGPARRPRRNDPKR